MVQMDPVTDHRGFNARAWCERELAEAGLEARIAQVNVIGNQRRGTLRGLHWQAHPAWEAKLFRVIRGAVYDVVVDLRPESPTFLDWTSVELRAGEHKMLYVPAGFAQGFQTLEDDTELMYLVSEPYSPDLGRGFRFDDPAFDIRWPLEVSEVSQKDRSWPDFQEASLDHR